MSETAHLGSYTLLEQTLAARDSPEIMLSELVGGVGERSFGIALVLICIPALVPGLGAVSGPVSAFIGVQMMLGWGRLWLPRWLGARALSRDLLKRALRKSKPFIERVERILRPRMKRVWRHAGWVWTGFLVFLLGLLLSLPIPFTNYLIAAPIALIGLALAEHDGGALITGWVSGIVAMVIVIVAYTVVITALVARFT